MTSATMPPGDSWSWSEARTLFEICSGARPWHSNGLTSLRPDYQTIYQAFSIGQVDGRMLYELNEQNLKADLGVTSLRDRRYVLRAVELLGKHSPEYQDWLRGFSVDIEAQTIGTVLPQASHIASNLSALISEATTLNQVLSASISASGASTFDPSGSTIGAVIPGSGASDPDSSTAFTGVNAFTSRSIADTTRPAVPSIGSRAQAEGTSRFEPTSVAPGSGRNSTSPESSTTKTQRADADENGNFSKQTEASYSEAHCNGSNDTGDIVTCQDSSGGQGSTTTACDDRLSLHPEGTALKEPQNTVLGPTRPSNSSDNILTPQSIDPTSLSDGLVNLENDSDPRSPMKASKVANNDATLPASKGKKRLAAHMITTTKIDPSRYLEFAIAAGRSMQDKSQGENGVTPIILTHDKPQEKSTTTINNVSQGNPVEETQSTANDTHRVHVSNHNLVIGDHMKQSGAKCLIDCKTQINMRAARNPGPSFLGRKTRVDNIFYPCTKLGKPITPEEIVYGFQHTHSECSAGQRQFVGNMIKHYFLAPVHSFTRNNKNYAAILPYNPRLAEYCYQPSFTLFSVDESRDEVIATRKAFSEWPELHSLVQKSNKPEHFDIFNPNVLANIRSSAWDPGYLAQKWQDKEGGDEVLTVYGNSGSENEFDTKTWREIDREQTTQTLAASKASGLKPITSEEVNEAIDQGMADLLEKWTLERLPRLQKKDWKLWSKTHRKRSVEYWINSYQDIVSNITEIRLPSQRAEILRGIWTSQLQVRRQSRIMEQSINTREELRHKILVLESDAAPGKPVTAVRSTKIANVSGDGSGVDVSGADCSPSEAATDASENEVDNMGDFIVPDVDETHHGVQDDSNLLALSSEARDAPSAPFTKSRRPKDRLTATSPLRDGRAPSLSNEQKSPLSHRRGSLGGMASEEASTNATPRLKIKYSIKSKRFSTPSTPVKTINSATNPSSESKKELPTSFLSSSGMSPEIIDLCTPGKPRIRLNTQSSPIIIDDSSPISRNLSAGVDKASQSITDKSAKDSRLLEDDLYEEPSPSERGKKRRLVIVPTASDSDELSDETTPTKKKRRKLVENEEASDMRKLDRQRQAEQDERRKHLQLRLMDSHAEAEVDKDRTIVNVSKFPDHGYVYLNQLASRTVKNHQLEGIRFMWDQIVLNNEDGQGCLLAHTMGLGKSMQSISLLVAIAEAAASEDTRVSSQLPAAFRSPRVMILCPAGLVNNWIDELLLWAPPDALGVPMKVDAQLLPDARRMCVHHWYRTGGVLVIGYDMFRAMVNNTKRVIGVDEEEEQPNVKKKFIATVAYHEDVHQRLTFELLEGPCIVIADEAHMLKNAAAQITMAAKRFKTKSRIALTGSPLANNVEEYYHMIQWVAPNYLGPISEFRQKYKIPIEEGLYEDSTKAQRKYSLKMRLLLQADLAPKIHRADMTVLAAELPSKKEFIISVPLTKLQREAYIIYVRSMLSGVELTRHGKFVSTTIWSWLSMLQLLCNHPRCFFQKIKKATNPMRSTQRGNRVNEMNSAAPKRDDLILTEVSLTAEDADQFPIHISENLAQEESNLLLANNVDIFSNELSYKMKILELILDASKSAGDKVLVFSHSVPTLDFLTEFCKTSRRKFMRMDGNTNIDHRQNHTKEFNSNDCELYLISSKAGGQGLNLHGANRVVVFDFGYNPIIEQQAIARAYRIGQKKPVFVYRLIVGGTFEETVYNKTIYKTQLAAQVVDKQNTISKAQKRLGAFLFEPKDIPQTDVTGFRGIDPHVLDRLLAFHEKNPIIRSIDQTDSYEQIDAAGLSEAQEDVVEEIKLMELRRKNPEAWNAEMQRRETLQTSSILLYNQRNGYVKNAQPGHNNLPNPLTGPATLAATNVPASTINKHAGGSSRDSTWSRIVTAIEQGAIKKLGTFPNPTPQAKRIATAVSQSLRAEMQNTLRPNESLHTALSLAATVLEKDITKCMTLAEGTFTSSQFAKYLRQYQSNS